MATAVESVLDKSCELKCLLLRLKPAERDSEPIRKAVAELQDFGVAGREKTIDTRKERARPLHDHASLTLRAKKKRRGCRIDGLLDRDHLEQVGLSLTGAKTLDSIVRKLGKRLTEHTHHLTAFSSFNPSSGACPAHIFEICHVQGAQNAIEYKILALLAAHAFDGDLDDDANYSSVLREWSQKIGRNLEEMKVIERVGRCCLGILGARGNYGAGLDRSGFGLLAMLDSHTISLKLLAGHGHTVLQACKSVQNFQVDAWRLASDVRSSILTTAARCKVLVTNTSRLGQILHHSDWSQDHPPQENGQSASAQAPPQVAVRLHCHFQDKADTNMTVRKSDANKNTNISEAASNLLSAMQSDAEGGVAVSSQAKADMAGKSKVIVTEKQEAKAAFAAAEVAAARAGRPLPPSLKPTWKAIPDPQNFAHLEVDAIEGLLKIRYPPVPRPQYSPLTPPANKADDKGGEFQSPVTKNRMEANEEKGVLPGYTDLEVDAIRGLMKLSKATAGRLTP